LTVNALLLAVGTLTALPVPAPRAVNSRVAGRAMLLAPIAVLPLAVLVGGLAAAGEALGLPSLLTALLCVGAGALGTRGLHWDGLADTADGLSSSYDRDRALEVMRSGDIGPSGVVAVVLVLGGQAAALAGAIAAGHGPFAAVVGVLAGRMVLALCCVRGIPAARSGGLGATVAGTVGRSAATAALVVGVGLVAAGSLVVALPAWRAALAVAVGVLGAALLLARCVRRLGGVTGDVLGACVEIATLGTLVGLSFN
jgi:adenosylcobinamide-GDP ribazoletransferase